MMNSYLFTHGKPANVHTNIYTTQRIPNDQGGALMMTFADGEFTIHIESPDELLDLARRIEQAGREMADMVEARRQAQASAADPFLPTPEECREIMEEVNQRG